MNPSKNSNPHSQSAASATTAASVLAVGTELLLGQTINGNAAWISKQLARLGLATKFHLTVADSRPQMLSALKECASQTELIFVTGGLGPTSDDFTRDVIAEHLGLKLVWDEKAWDWIVERMSSRGMVVRDIQKQQCYFPEGAEILINAQGTAHGFYCGDKTPDRDRHYFVLPGPPREVSAVWQARIDTLLSEVTGAIDPLKTKIWDAIGLGESEVAHLTEPLLAKVPRELIEQVEVGYRVHLPYVEFKLTFRESLSKELAPLISDVEAALAAHVLSRDGEDVVAKVGEELQKITAVSIKEFLILDEVSDGFLLQRLLPVLRGVSPQPLYFAPTLSCAWEQEAKHVLKLRWTPGTSNTTAEIEVRLGNEVMKSSYTYPNASPLMRERAKQFFAEHALSFWGKTLHNYNRHVTT